MSENENEEKENSEEETEESEDQETEEDSEEESEEDTSEDDSEEEVDWKARALKAEKLIQKRKKQSKKAPSQPNKEGDDDALAEVRQKVDSLERIEKKREFGYRNNLSPDVVDKVFSLKEDPKDEDLDDPFIKAGVQALQNQKKNEANTPESNTRSFGQRLVGKKTKTRAEKQQEFEKFMKARGAR